MLDSELSLHRVPLIYARLKPFEMEVRFNNIIYKQADINLLKRNHVMYGYVQTKKFETEYDLISKFALSKVDSWFINVKGNTLNTACLIYLFLPWFVYNAVEYILIGADILKFGKQLQKNLVTFL